MPGKTDHLKKTGAPSLEELHKSPGFPAEKVMKKGPLAFIECIENIPCNPCETACPKGAIKVGQPIINLPVLDTGKCMGCGLCIAACPGLAIYVKDYTYSADEALITFPFEYYPLPSVGDSVTMVNRYGEPVCSGKITRVNCAERNNKTPVITASFPKEYFDEVISIKRLSKF